MPDPQSAQSTRDDDRPPTGAELRAILQDAAERGKPVVRQMKGLSARLLEMTSRPDSKDPR